MRTTSRMLLLVTGVVIATICAVLYSIQPNGALPPMGQWPFTIHVSV